MKRVVLQAGNSTLNNSNLNKNEDSTSISAAVFSSTILSALEAERERVSRELHDALGQQLSFLEVQIQTLATGSSLSPEEMAERARSLRSLVAGIASDVHRICYKMHPVILETLGLSVAIETLCTESESASGVPVRLLQRKVPNGIPKEIALALYRVAQESLHNIAKHAAASSVVVDIRGIRDEIQLTVTDNGRGFDPSAARPAGVHLGIASLTERVRLVGGRFSLESAPGRGTKIAVSVPLPAAAQAARAGASDSIGHHVQAAGGGQAMA